MTTSTSPLRGEAPKIKELVSVGYSRKPETRWPTYGGEFLDRAAFVTSSEAGNCARMIWFGKHTDEYVPETTGKAAWGYWERGHNVEAWVVEQLQRSGLVCMFTGDNQRSFHHGAQSGTPDGLVKWEEVWYCLEIKSIDPRTNVRGLPKKPNVIQTQQNMDLMNHCLQDQNIAVQGSLLYYQDASDYSLSFDFFVEADPEEQERLEHRALHIMAAKSPEDLPPEGLYNSGCGYCEFTKYCSEVVQKKKDLSKEEAARKLMATKLF